MKRYTVLAPCAHTAAELTRAVEARGGFARHTTHRGFHIVMALAPKRAFSAAARAVQFRPGLAEGYNSGRAL